MTGADWAQAREREATAPKCVTCGDTGEVAVHPGASVDPYGTPVRGDCPDCDQGASA